MTNHKDLSCIPGFKLIKQLPSYDPSEIWKAYSERSDQFVILHYLAIDEPIGEEAQRRFMREAGICARLNNPGLVRFLTQGITNTHLWFATELIEGMDLRQFMTKRQPITLDVATAIIIQALDVMDYLHQEGVVHRSLQPESFIIKEESGTLVVRLADLGGAKCFRTADLEATVTRLGERGYPIHAFIAPEILENPHFLDPRSDVYALGGILYFLLTDRNPYDSTDENLLINRIVEENPIPVHEIKPNLPETIIEVVERAMARDINRRYNTVQEVQDAFRQAIGEEIFNRNKLLSPSIQIEDEKNIHFEKGGSLMIKILFLAANPSDTTRIRLDEESRAVDQALRQAEFRDLFDIKQHWAVRVKDIQGLLLRHRPDIVHFSGHGSKSNEIILEDNLGNSHPVSIRALSQLFSVLKDNIRCVVLNACYSEQQAKAIARHIDCVVGMSKAIGDSAAISFAAAFYQALGYGRDVKTAFDLGCVQIDLENLDEQDTPKLLAINDEPEKIVLVGNV